MIDRAPTSETLPQSRMDALCLWIRRDLQQQFRRSEALPQEMLALIDAAFTIDKP